MAQQKKQQQEQAMGKSCGCLSTKIHAAVDAWGNQVRLLLTAGQTSEYTQAEALIAGFEAGYVLADKGYDSDAFVSTITENQAIPVIPAKKNRKVSREFDQNTGRRLESTGAGGPLCRAALSQEGRHGTTSRHAAALTRLAYRTVCVIRLRMKISADQTDIGNRPGKQAVGNNLSIAQTKRFCCVSKSS